MNSLSLERWRELLSLSPLHFWGLASQKKFPVTSRCNGVMPQYAWQNADAISRVEIARAIEDAEDFIASYLNYNVVPKAKEVTVPFPRPTQTGLAYYGSPIDPNGQWMSVNLSERYIQAVGLETMDYIGDADINYVDLDGDGFTEAFECSIEAPLAITDPNEIVCFPRIKFVTISGSVYIEPKEYGQAQFDCQDIPLGNLCVTMDAGQGCSSCNVATITGYKWLLVRPNLYEAILWNTDGLDPDTDVYCDKIAVYRKYISAGGTTKDTAQAVLYWETTPCPGWGCTSAVTNNSQDPATVGYAIGRVGIRDALLGHVTPAESVYDSTTDTWSGVSCLTSQQLPDRVTIRYSAGYPWQQNRRMDNKLESAVMALSAARLNRDICLNVSKNAGETRLHYYQRDMARSAGNNDEQYAYISREDLSNPFGTRFGEISAWKIVSRQKILAGITAG